MGDFSPVNVSAILANNDQRKRDKLRDMYLGKEHEQQNTLFNQGQQDRTQQQQEHTQDRTQQQQMRYMEIIHRAAQAVEASDDPVGLTGTLLSSPQMVEAFQGLGIDPKGFDPNATPESVKQGAARMRQSVEPFLPQAKPEAFTLSQGETRFEGGKPVASVAPKPEKPDKPTQAPSQFRPLTSEEMLSMGLPAGSSAQVDMATGKVDVLSKKDVTGSLSKKDATIAKIKLNTVQLARQQLGRIRTQFGKIKGTLAAGPESRVMVLSEGSQKFDAAVNQMRSTLTALTRVPGVGAMSDYETKLDQSKFPDRLLREGVTEQQIGDLDAALNLIESGYTDLLSGGEPAAQPAATQPAITATGPNGQKLVLQNGQWVPLGN